MGNGPLTIVALATICGIIFLVGFGLMLEKEYRWTRARWWRAKWPEIKMIVIFAAVIILLFFIVVYLAVRFCRETYELERVDTEEMARGG